MSSYHLAQVNISRLLAPLTSERLQNFVDALAPVNAIADAAPGFVWRLQTEDGDATAIRVFDDDEIIVNMSTWASLEQFADFVYSPGHASIMRGRRQWFARPLEAMTALWWIPHGVRPTPVDAESRLATLRQLGPTVEAFTLRNPFPAPDTAENPVVRQDWSCPA